MTFHCENENSRKKNEYFDKRKTISKDNFVFWLLKKLHTIENNFDHLKTAQIFLHERGNRETEKSIF